MKTKELKQLSVKSLSEIETELKKIRTELAHKRSELLSGKEKNLRVVKNLRKSLAQTLTLQSIIKRREKTEKKEGAK